MEALRYRDWLSARIDPEHVDLAFLFGSVLLDSKTANDCDLFLVTQAEPATSKWIIQRSLLKQLSRLFEEAFNLKLSIELLSQQEYVQWLTWKDTIFHSPKLLILGDHGIA